MFASIELDFEMQLNRQNERFHVLWHVQHSFAVFVAAKFHIWGKNNFDCDFSNLNDFLLRRGFVSWAHNAHQIAILVVSKQSQKSNSRGFSHLFSLHATCTSHIHIHIRHKVRLLIFNLYLVYVFIEDHNSTQNIALLWFSPSSNEA